MGNDLRFAFRSLTKSPGFTVMAVIALALGIGANTAIFSVVNAAILQKMPFENPDRLVMVWEHSPRTARTNVVNSSNFIAWQDRNHSFERIAALVEFDSNLTGDGEPEVIRNLAVSDGFFQILGIQPAVGRWFTAEEDTPGHDQVAILSNALWQRRYGSDPNILNQKIQVSRQEYRIVGVMPAGFRFPSTKAELWQPLAIDRSKQSRGRSLSTIARLRDGVSIEAAQAEMNIIASQLEKERPEFDTKWGVTIVGLREQAIGDVRTPLLILLAAVGLVLLIACANVANLMLMRAAGRGREIAIRGAIGATAGRIARQLLVESTLLAFCGGALGLLVGLQAVQLLTTVLPNTIAYSNLKTIHIDTTVFLFTMAISLATGILFGLAPALKAARIDIQQSLRDGGRGVAGHRSVVRQILVVAEVALSMMLLIGAGLLIRSFSRLASIDPGFDARHVLSMQLSEVGLFNDRTTQENGKFLEFNQQMLQRVRAISGVEAAGTSHFLPLGRIIPGTGFWRTDQPRPEHGSEPVTDVLVVMPGYFSTMSIPLISGRVFDNRDTENVPHTLVINQTLARQFYPNEDPIGKTLTVQWGPKPYQIVGVVADVQQRSLDKKPIAQVFISNMQEPTGPVYLVARTHGDPKLLANAIQAEIHSLNRNLPISDVRSMDEYVSDSVAAPRFNTILLGGFAALALLLASVGIFGVISYSVAQRTQELGIRRALGADSASVLRLVLGQGMGLTAIGIVIGLGGAFAVTRSMGTLLYGITATDPVTFIAVAIVLSAVAFIASFIPARRASKIDPIQALRYE